MGSSASTEAEPEPGSRSPAVRTGASGGGGGKPQKRDFGSAVDDAASGAGSRKRRRVQEGEEVKARGEPGATRARPTPVPATRGPRPALQSPRPPVVMLPARKDMKSNSTDPPFLINDRSVTRKSDSCRLLAAFHACSAVPDSLPLARRPAHWGATSSVGTKRARPAEKKSRGASQPNGRHRYGCRAKGPGSLDGGKRVP